MRKPPPESLKDCSRPILPADLLLQWFGLEAAPHPWKRTSIICPFLGLPQCGRPCFYTYENTDIAKPVHFC